MRAAFVFVLCGLFFLSQAQNLVPNPSFEFFVSCPNNQDQLFKATPWLSPTGTTPDYYNACTSSIVSVPTNWYGFQNARTGSAYAGFASYYYCNFNCREYIEAPLLDTLLPGRKYCVSFYVSLADSSFNGIAPIGAYLSDTIVNNLATVEYLQVTPQISSPALIPISDTLNWILVSGSFIANGGEKFIIIGTFVTDTNLTIDTVRTSFLPIEKFAYYYIDDISVTEVIPCNSNTNYIICLADSIQLGSSPEPGVTYSWAPNSGLSNDSSANPIASPLSTTTYTLTQTQCDAVCQSVFTLTVKRNCDSSVEFFIPTILKAYEQLYVSGLEPRSSLEIFDMRGRLVFQSNDYENNFRANQVGQGIYIIRFVSSNGEIVKQKLCVIE